MKGPLVVKHNDLFYLVGVVSAGIGCEGKKNIFFNAFSGSLTQLFFKDMECIQIYLNSKIG